MVHVIVPRLELRALLAAEESQLPLPCGAVPQAARSTAAGSLSVTQCRECRGPGTLTGRGRRQSAFSTRQPISRQERSRQHRRESGAGAAPGRRWSTEPGRAPPHPGGAFRRLQIHPLSQTTGHTVYSTSCMNFSDIRPPCTLI
jgi:hypothetical protein